MIDCSCRMEDDRLEPGMRSDEDIWAVMGKYECVMFEMCRSIVSELDGTLHVYVYKVR
jgi:hypothetical protein